MAREHSSTCPICCARVLKTEETTDGYELSGALSSIGFPKLQSARQCGAYELTTVLGLGADNAMSVPRRAANVVSTARATGLSLTSFSDRSLAAVFCQVLVGHVAGFFPASWLLHEGVGYSPGFALVA